LARATIVLQDCKSTKTVLQTRDSFHHFSVNQQIKSDYATIKLLSYSNSAAYYLAETTLIWFYKCNVDACF
jgi:hypothetical protein